MRGDQTRTEHSRVLSDVSLVPETVGISIIWLGKLACVCIIMLWPAMIDISFLPIALGIDVLVVLVAVIGKFLTPSHLDSTGKFVRALLSERWGQDMLVNGSNNNNE